METHTVAVGDCLHRLVHLWSPAYSYGTSGKPHRLTSVTIGGIANTLSYDANGNTTSYDAASGNDTFLSYDGQNNVTKITVGTSAGTSTPTARDEFWYDPDGQRFLGRESWDAAGVQRQARTVYLGAFEEVIPAASSTFNLVQRTDLSAGVRHIRTRTTAGVVATRFEYVHRDHLGSADVVTNASGTMLNNKTSFDPFGGRRAKNWATDISAADLTTLLTNEDERWARGFTEHEMLNRTGFIHMNGRVYDPRIGRFVSPDPIVQSPTFSQSYNRYAYVFNSPLSFTDPSGFITESDGTATLTQLWLAQEQREYSSMQFERLLESRANNGSVNAYFGWHSWLNPNSKTAAREVVDEAYVHTSPDRNDDYLYGVSHTAVLEAQKGPLLTMAGALVVPALGLAAGTPSGQAAIAAVATRARQAEEFHRKLSNAAELRIGMRIERMEPGFWRGFFQGVRSAYGRDPAGDPFDTAEGVDRAAGYAAGQIASWISDALDF